MSLTYSMKSGPSKTVLVCKTFLRFFELNSKKAYLDQTKSRQEVVVKSFESDELCLECIGILT